MDGRDSTSHRWKARVLGAKEWAWDKAQSTKVTLGQLAFYRTGEVLWSLHFTVTPQDHLESGGTPVGILEAPHLLDLPRTRIDTSTATLPTALGKL